MITLKAYAKINLALEVMDTVDGYHKVNNVMIPISIYDELSFEKSDSITIKDDPFPSQNIIEKAAKVFFEYTKIKGGVYIELKKNIPHAAGLAGGSTDAACTLKGLNELYQANLTNEELLLLSAKLGSDVGFFIETKTALCTGRGEKVEVLPIHTPVISLALIKPDTGLSTALVYKNYVYDGISKEDKIKSLILGLDMNNLSIIKESIFNDLAPVALKLNEKLFNIYNKLTKLGLHPFISGSGPTMYVLNPSEMDIKIIEEAIDDTVFFTVCNTF